MSDSTGVPGDEVPYENAAGRIWGDTARGLHQGRRLQVAAFDGQGVVSVQVWGPCPRCGHDINVKPILTAPVAGLRDRGVWAALTGRNPRGGSGVPGEVEVGCGCGRVHPGAPERGDGQGKVPGCGVSFHLPTSPPTAPASSGGLVSPDAPQDNR